MTRNRTSILPLCQMMPNLLSHVSHGKGILENCIDEKIDARELI